MIIEILFQRFAIITNDLENNQRRK